MQTLSSLQFTFGNSCKKLWIWRKLTNITLSHLHRWRMGNHDYLRHHIVVITVLAEYWVTFKVYMLRDHSEQAAPCPIVLTLINDHLHQGSPQPGQVSHPRNTMKGLCHQASPCPPHCHHVTHHPDTDLMPCLTWTRDQESHSRFTLKATSSRA